MFVFQVKTAVKPLKTGADVVYAKKNEMLPPE